MEVIVKDGLPLAEYLADPAPEPSLSAHIAHILVSQSPLHAWDAHPRLNPDYRPQEREEFDIGSAAHALLLEGEDRMAECDFDSWRTNASKDAASEARKSGKIPLLSKHVARVRKMAEVARKSLAESELAITEWIAERSVWWEVGLPGIMSSMRSIWCRARFDMLVKDRPIVLDYKTVESADPWQFQRSMIAYGYDVQAAFYTMSLRTIMAEQKISNRSDRFVFVLQEKSPPFACSFVAADPSVIDLGTNKIAIAKHQWAQCLRSGKWPGYPLGLWWAEAPGWALEQFEQRHGERQ